MSNTLTRRPTWLSIILVLTTIVVLVVFLVLEETRRHGHASLTFKPTSFDWSKAKQYYPVDSNKPLPNVSHAAVRLPRVQADFNGSRELDATNETRRKAVRNAFLRTWNGYREYAWLRDELMPVSGGWRNKFGGWAATLVDSLDTLWIMDLKSEFYEAAAAAVQIDWENTNATTVSVFETTIRHLGGLLSGYDLSGEKALLQKATELGDMLYMAFDTPNHMPSAFFCFEDAKQGRQIAGANEPSTAAASLNLEFTRLAQLTGDNKYYDAINRVTDFMERSQEQSKLPGMWPTLINFETMDVSGKINFGIGAAADSVYEYLIKMVILTEGTVKSYESMYRRAMEVVTGTILFRPLLPDGQNVLMPGSAIVGPNGFQLQPASEHLACFAGGMFALGGRVLNIPEHIETGERLARGCARGYQAFSMGMLPEAFTMWECPTDRPCSWDKERWKAEGNSSLPKGFTKVGDARYLLRPEAVESLFVLYRITGNETLVELAWDMFQSIARATETTYGYSAITDVTRTNGTTVRDNSAESYWTAETLKYFYLIFSPPDLISLDEFVLSTEAHPFRRAAPDKLAG